MSDDSHMEKLTLKVRFDSDWHVGDGAGQPGYIDRIVRKDPGDELPYLPAKTLLGIWRDACEAVAAALDQGANGPGSWSDLVNVIFGDQPARDGTGDVSLDGQYDRPLRKARVTMRPGRLPDLLREHLRQSAPLRQAVTLVKPGVKIDRATGQALDEHLRFDEVVRGGAELDATFDWDESGLGPDQALAARALMWSGTQVVERLGGKRRRGLGRCAFEVAAFATQRDALLTRLEGKPPTDLEDTGQQDARDLAGLAAGDGDSTGWLKLPLKLTLKAPVIVPKKVVGNVAESLNFVPGTLLLGPVTSQLNRNAGRSLFHEIARGDIRVLHAYPEVDEQRGLPVPLALFRAKESRGLEDAVIIHKADPSESQQTGGGTIVWNRLVEPEPADQQPKQHRSGFLGPRPADDGLPSFADIDLQVTTHGTIDDVLQRPTSEVGGVFSFQAIPAGTVLRSELRLKKSVVAELERRGEHWWEGLSGEIRVGIAKKDDYGLVDLSAQPPEAVLVQASESGEFVVWLLSDLLLRNEYLQPATSIDDLCRAVLRRLDPGGELQLEVQVRGNDPANRLLASVLRTRRTEGWHNRWVLPRPSYVGVMAGSCAVFTISGWEGRSLEQQTAIRERMRRMVADGLGERRAEGFGEVAVDDPRVTEKYSTKKRRLCKLTDATSTTDLPRIEQGDAGREFAERIEIAAWRDWIRRAALGLGSNKDERRRRLGKWTEQKPPNNQLGSIRAIVAGLQSRLGTEAAGKEIERITDWIQKVEKTRNRADKWPKGALRTVMDLVKDEETIWRWLADASGTKPAASGDGGRPAGQLPPVMSAGGVDRLKSELWAEAVRTLLYACIRGETRDREKN